MPGCSINGIIEAVGGLELLFDVFSVGVGWRVGREVELTEGSVGGVSAESSAGFGEVKGTKGAC